MPSLKAPTSLKTTGGAARFPKAGIMQLDATPLAHSQTNRCVW
jgi:hypothetical protein